MEKSVFKSNIYKVLALSNEQEGRFNRQLGLELLDCCGEDVPWIEFRYKGTEAHRNPYGGIHGGIISALADTCSGMGAVALTGCYVTTTDLHMSFIRAMAGTHFRIHVDYTHIGRTLIRCMGKIYDEDTGKLMATSMASFMAFDNKPPGLRD
ncbi:PaaI family thioesterase [Eubacterium sp. AB3007]|uniref:PaaI family thioesterase n=1 Tax=Eubacterium sp. AB3007 TaxID=1392487 RepID=UPI00068B0A49|nr:PaaI family thioesterase [Eubacterium sp. AB3007]